MKLLKRTRSKVLRSTNWRMTRRASFRGRSTPKPSLATRVSRASKRILWKNSRRSQLQDLHSNQRMNLKHESVYTIWYNSVFLLIMNRGWPTAETPMLHFNETGLTHIFTSCEGIHLKVVPGTAKNTHSELTKLLLFSPTKVPFLSVSNNPLPTACDIRRKVKISQQRT